jgi:hypothetical protein
MFFNTEISGKCTNIPPKAWGRQKIDESLDNMKESNDSNTDLIALNNAQISGAEPEF